MIMEKLQLFQSTKLLKQEKNKNVLVSVILGAFGCGAFKNNPEIVAQAYKNILPEFNHAFKTIEFAIFCKGEDTTNYTTFKKIIG